MSGRHASDCAVHSEPAYPAGPCDCHLSIESRLDEMIDIMNGNKVTDRELMQQALDALIWTTGSDDFSETGKARKGAVKVLFPAIEALRARLAQPEPEPVAWMVVDDADGKVEHVSRTKECSQSWLQYVATRKLLPLYTAPPQRKEWQGLTDEEILECTVAAERDYAKHMTATRGQQLSQRDQLDWWIASAIEAKLKEKNT